MNRPGHCSRAPDAIAALVVVMVAATAAAKSLDDLRREKVANEQALERQMHADVQSGRMSPDQAIKHYGPLFEANRQTYKGADPRPSDTADLNNKLNQAGMELRSTGGRKDLTPKDINADVDAVPVMKATGLGPQGGKQAEAQDIIRKHVGDKIVENPAKIVDTGKDATYWKAPTPEGEAAKKQDPDAFKNPGSLAETRNPGQYRKDESGYISDLRAKTEEARTTGDLKGEAKGLVKAESSSAVGPLVIKTDSKGNVVTDAQTGRPVLERSSLMPRTADEQRTLDTAKALTDYKTGPEAGLYQPGATKDQQDKAAGQFDRNVQQRMDDIQTRADTKSAVRDGIRSDIQKGYESSPDPAIRKLGGTVAQERDNIKTSNESTEKKVDDLLEQPPAPNRYTGGYNTGSKPASSAAGASDPGVAGQTVTTITRPSGNTTTVTKDTGPDGKNTLTAQSQSFTSKDTSLTTTTQQKPDGSTTRTRTESTVSGDQTQTRTVKTGADGKVTTTDQSSLVRPGGDRTTVSTTVDAKGDTTIKAERDWNAGGGARGTTFTTVDPKGNVTRGESVTSSGGSQSQTASATRDKDGNLVSSQQSTTMTRPDGSQQQITSSTKDGKDTFTVRNTTGQPTDPGGTKVTTREITSGGLTTTDSRSQSSERTTQTPGSDTKTTIRTSSSSTDTRLGDTTIKNERSVKASAERSWAEGQDKPKPTGPQGTIKLAEMKDVIVKDQALVNKGVSGGMVTDGGTDLSGSIDVKAGQMKADSTVLVTSDGQNLKASGTLAAEANLVKVTADAKATQKMGDVGRAEAALKGDATAGVDGKLRAGAQAGADGVKADLEASAFAGFKAKGSASATLNLNSSLGIKLTGKGEGEVSAGVGGSASADVEASWTKIKVGGGASLTTGVGAGGKASFEVDAEGLITWRDPDKDKEFANRADVKANIIAAIKSGQMELPPGKKFGDLLPEINERADWLYNHPPYDKDGNKLDPSQAIMGVLGFTPKPAGNQVATTTPGDGAKGDKVDGITSVDDLNVDGSSSDDADVDGADDQATQDAITAGVDDGTQAGQKPSGTSSDDLAGALGALDDDTAAAIQAAIDQSPDAPPADDAADDTGPYIPPPPTPRWTPAQLQNDNWNMGSLAGHITDDIKDLQDKINATHDSAEKKRLQDEIDKKRKDLQAIQDRVNENNDLLAQQGVGPSGQGFIGQNGLTADETTRVLTNAAGQAQNNLNDLDQQIQDLQNSWPIDQDKLNDLINRRNQAQGNLNDINNQLATGQDDGSGYNPGDDTDDTGGADADQLAAAGDLQDQMWDSDPSQRGSQNAGSGDDGGYAIDQGDIGGDIAGDEARDRDRHGSTAGDHAGRDDSSTATGAPTNPFDALDDTVNQIAGTAQGVNQAVDQVDDLTDRIRNGKPPGHGGGTGGGSGDGSGAGGGMPGGTQIAQGTGTGSGGGGKPPGNGGAGGNGGTGGQGGQGGNGGKPPAGTGSGTSTNGTGGGGGDTVVVTQSGTAQPGAGGPPGGAGGPGGSSGASGSGGYSAAPQDQTIDGTSALAGRTVTGVRVSLTYDAYGIPDEFQIVYSGGVIASTGNISGGGTINGNGGGNSALVTIRVITRDTSTSWNWNARVEYTVQ